MEDRFTLENTPAFAVKEERFTVLANRFWMVRELKVPVPIAICPTDNSRPVAFEKVN